MFLFSKREGYIHCFSHVRWFFIGKAITDVYISNQLRLDADVFWRLSC